MLKGKTIDCEWYVRVTSVCECVGIIGRVGLLRDLMVDDWFAKWFCSYLTLSFLVSSWSWETMDVCESMGLAVDDVEMTTLGTEKLEAFVSQRPWIFSYDSENQRTIKYISSNFLLHNGPENMLELRNPSCYFLQIFSKIFFHLKFLPFLHWLTCFASWAAEQTFVYFSSFSSRVQRL